MEIHNTSNKNSQSEINACLDEIEISIDIMSQKVASGSIKAQCKGWMLKQKFLLKSLGFNGKMPRKKRQSNILEEV